MILAIALLAALLQNPAADPRQAQKASISGVALNAGTGEPMPNVRVVLARTDFNLGLFSQLAAAAGERPPIEMSYSAETLAAMMGPAASEDTPDAAAFSAALKSLPLAEIHEVIIGTSGKLAVVAKSSPPGVTDDRGRFSFNDVEPGTYRLIFESPGFSKRDFGQSTVSGEGVPLLLVSGQVRTDVVMRLSAVAAINGRIRDATGQPATGVPVELFRFEYDENANRTVKRVARTRANDRGEYRMYYLSPGRYYLSAGEEGGLVGFGFDGMGAVGAGLDFLMVGRGYVTPNRISQRYSLTYYPGLPDVNRAAPIDLQSGADLQGIDLLVQTQKPYRVSGRVVDPRTGQPPPAAEIQMTPDTADPSSFLAGFISAGAEYKATDGTFVIQNVAPGPYFINVTLPGPPPSRSFDPESLSAAERRAQFRADMELQRAQPRAVVPVNVANADVEGLVLTLATGYSIPGRFRVEPGVANRPPQWGFLRASLSSPKMGWLNNDVVDPTAPDGTFRTNHVQPGEYRLSVSGVPPGFFIKHARLGNADVLNAPVRVLGQTDTLDILLSPNVGEVKGVAVDAAGQPVQGAQVVLIPQRNRQRTELFRPVAADSSGRFSIPSVEPGDYILAAWDSIEPYAFFDPDLIAQAERLGRPIQVTESSSQTANVTTIP